jgi:hypothetical protein
VDDADEVGDGAIRAAERHLRGGEHVPSAGGIGDRLLRDRDLAPGREHLDVLGPEEVGLALGEEVVVGLA